MKKCRYTLLVLVHLISLLAYTQNQQLKFQPIGAKDGLSDPNVMCIMQDSRGFIWVGTRYGLNRYDGHQFKVFYSDPADSESISNNYIQHIIEDSKGNIWVATSGGGFNKFDRKKNRFKQYLHHPDNPNSVSDNNITKIIEDRTGKLWIATNDGINLFNPETNHFIQFFHDKNDPKTISDNNVTDVFIDSKGDIWLGTQNGGLNRFMPKDSTFVSYQINSINSKENSGSNIYTIFEDSRQRFWIGTSGEGLNLFDRKSGKFRQFKHTSGINFISTSNVIFINEDNNGNLLIGTENGGINLLDSTLQKLTNYVCDEIDANSLSANSVHSIKKDNEGNIWVGVYAGGINLFRKSTASFNHYKHNSSPSSLSNNFVLSIYEDRNENLWVGTDGGGLNRFDVKTGKFHVYKHNPSPNSISGDYVTIVTGDKKDHIWIGTWGGGLSKLNLKTQEFTNFKSNNSKQGISSNNIYALTVTRDEKIWIGTFGTGLDIYDPKTNSFSHFVNNKDDKNSLSSDKIYTTLEDKGGNIWIGTSGGGINLFEPKTNSFIRFNKENKNLITNTVYHLLETSSGKIYACTPSSGLLYFDPTNRQFIPIESQNIFTSKCIYAALEDQKGNIWVSTNKGISKYDPETKAVKNYSVEDGLQGTEFKAHSAFKAKSGMLYFGGVNGFNSFSPDQIIDNSYNPPIVLTDFQIFNKSVAIARDENDPSPLTQDISETKSIRLSHKQSVITFEFASLDFSSLATKVYAYMLEGFDNDWNMVGNKNSATYTNLNAGDYVFKVKSQSRSGVWSPQILSLNLTITPPFWLTWWFKILMGLILVIIPLVLIYWRINQLHKQRKNLEKLVFERTNEIQSKNEQLKALNSTKDKLFSVIAHDLRSPFNTILGFQDLLLDDYYELSDADRLKMIRQVHTTTNQVCYLVENLLNWARVQNSNIQYQPANLNLKEVILEKLDLYRNIAESKGVDLSFELSDNLIAFADINLLETSLRNLINNAIKFTLGGGSILVKTSTKQEDILILVIDSGTGMTQEQIKTLFNPGKNQTKNGTNGEKGSGLGLLLCKEFVEKNKGTLFVESQLGTGSTFSFTVPGTFQE